MALTDRELTTVSDVETELGLTPGAQDTRLERFIKAATRDCENFCHRRFDYDAALVEKAAGYGTPFLHVARTPMWSVGSITFAGDTVDSDDYEIYGDGRSGMVYHPSGWTWTGVVAGGLIITPVIAGTERLRYTITYAGGWETPNATPTSVEDLPPNIEIACIQLVTQYWFNAGLPQNIKAESIMSTSVTYERDGSIPKETQRILKPYRRMVGLPAK